jgi:hypothetical protein
LSEEDDNLRASVKGNLGIIMEETHHTTLEFERERESEYVALLSQPLFSELDDSFAPTCSRLSSTLS